MPSSNVIQNFEKHCTILGKMINQKHVIGPIETIRFRYWTSGVLEPFNE